MRALVLSGGGVKGAYQVGALRKWMGDDALDYDILCGISVGAINAAYLAQTEKGQPLEAYEKLAALWARVDNAHVKRSWFPFGVLSAISKPSVYDSRPLQQWIKKELDPAAIRTSGRKLRVVAVSWDSGDSHVATEKDDHLPEWVAASSAFPVMLSPVGIGGESWTDGGLRSVTPLGEAIDAGADEIDVVMCSDPFARSPFASLGKPAVPDLAHRALDILTDEIMRADLQICGLKNHLARLKTTKHREVDVRILTPSKPLTDNALDFDPAEIRAMVKLGYEDAIAGARDVERLPGTGGTSSSTAA